MFAQSKYLDILHTTTTTTTRLWVRDDLGLDVEPHFSLLLLFSLTQNWIINLCHNKNGSSDEYLQMVNSYHLAGPFIPT